MALLIGEVALACAGPVFRGAPGAAGRRRHERDSAKCICERRYAAELRRLGMGGEDLDKRHEVVHIAILAVEEMRPRRGKTRPKTRAGHS